MSEQRDYDEAQAAIEGWAEKRVTTMREKVRTTPGSLIVLRIVSRDPEAGRQ